MSQTVLVTGHAGFIGSHLSHRLLTDGFNVVGVDNFNDYYSPAQKETNVKDLATHKKFTQYRLDILDTKGLKRVFEDQQFDSVVHLAARAGVRPSIVNPLLYEEVNVRGTLQILEMMRQFQVNHLVFGGSSSVYGNQTKVPFSETDPVNEPVSPYAATKKSAEMLIHSYSYLHEIKSTCLRFFTVYGPAGRPDMAPYLFTQKLLAGEAITKFGKGDSSRDYTYIDDIVSGIVAAVNRPLAYEIINLGNHQPVKLNDFISTLESLTGKKAQILSQPRNPADVKTTYADITKAKKLLNWQPKTDLKTGLKNFIDWYQEKSKS
jgi:UDP-glucuronate 4-epimerase